MSSTATALTLYRERAFEPPELALLSDPDPAGTGRDPAFIRSNLELLETFCSYFNPEVRGLGRLPVSGPFLIVGNHNGGATPPDMPILLTEWCKTRGVDEPVYGLFHSAFFNIPGVGSTMRKAGGIEASPDAAEHALRNRRPNDLPDPAARNKGSRRRAADRVGERFAERPAIAETGGIEEGRRKDSPLFKPQIFHKTVQFSGGNAL